jgi:glycopeptide antibiotics resistance protein
MFLLYHLSDVMWALALAESVHLITKNITFAVITTFILTVLFEVMQYFRIVKGTGDIWDILFVAVSLSIYFMIMRRRHENEKGP